MKRCPQCCSEKENIEFVRNGGERRWCNACAEVYKGGKGHKATRREKLNQQTELRVHLTHGSGNHKIGNIPMSLSSANTCPSSCSFKDSGCYAEFWPLRYHWEKVSERGVPWLEFCAQVRQLPEGQLWRHNVAGDLPGVDVDETNERIDVLKLDALVEANRGRRGFTYTHRTILFDHEWQAVHHANLAGFTINLSADSLEEADALAQRPFAPVVVVLPSDSPQRGLRTPAGRHVVVCPAQTHGLTCEKCQLCAVPNRKSIVGFRAHGQWKKKVNELVQLRRSA